MDELLLFGLSASLLLFFLAYKIPDVDDSNKYILIVSTFVSIFPIS